MNLDNLNNLIELFANQANKQNKKDIFLEWLNPSNKKTYTWEQTEKNILKLSKVIKENIKEGDRCLLVSENRPEWFVSDLAKSETNHSGLFSETKRHLSPSFIFSLITFDNFKIFFSVCSQVYVFLLLGFSHSKKISFLFCLFA